MTRITQRMNLLALAIEQGQALANQANTDYAALLERSVLDLLGMRETSITLDADQAAPLHSRA